MTSRINFPRPSTPIYQYSFERLDSITPWRWGNWFDKHPVGIFSWPAVLCACTGPDMLRFSERLRQL
jgi:hypothetical protein